jgi:2',5'-phosphodiesterase
MSYNWPAINNIHLPTSILAGFYVYPSKLELQFAEKKESEFFWFKGNLPKSSREDQIEWQEIGQGFSYLVKSEDVGSKLKVMLEISSRFSQLMRVIFSGQMHPKEW